MIEIHDRNAAGPHAQDAPRDGGATEIKDSHVRQVRKTTLEFFISLLPKTMSKRSGTVRIDQAWRPSCWTRR